MPQNWEPPVPEEKKKTKKKKKQMKEEKKKKKKNKEIKEEETKGNPKQAVAICEGVFERRRRKAVSICEKHCQELGEEKDPAKGPCEWERRR